MYKKDYIDQNFITTEILMGPIRNLKYKDLDSLLVRHFYIVLIALFVTR